MSITHIKSLQEKLYNVESLVNQAFSGGYYRLSTYLENFACCLFQIYYGYDFNNLNETITNNPGVDIYNEQKNHGIQVTNETPNSKKIEDTKRLSTEYSKVDVFFFTNSKSKVLKKKYSLKNLSVLTLSDIEDDALKNPLKCERYLSLLDIWFYDGAKIDSNIFTIFKNFSDKQFSENVNRNKYNKNLYVEEPMLKNICRSITIPSFGENFFFTNARRFFESPYFNFYLSTRAKGDGNTLIFKDEIKGYEIFLNNKQSMNFELEKSIYLKYFNYLDKCYGWSNKKSYFVESLNDKTGVDYYSFHSNEIFYSMLNENKYLNAIGKRIMFLIKDACGGKTCFLSNFYETVLIPRDIPTFYVNIRDIPGNLIEYIEKGITHLLGAPNLNSSFLLIKEYVSASNKRFVILLDGINETSNLVNTKREIAELCKYLQDCPEIALIMTVRPSIFDMYYRYDVCETSSYKDIVYVADDRTNDQREQEIHGDLLKEKYFKYYSVNCFVSNSVLKMLRENPLLLSIFCQIHKNDSKSVIKSLMTKDLFDKYFDDRGDKCVQSNLIDFSGEYLRFAISIAKLMIDKRNIYNINLSDIPNANQQLLRYVLDNDILISENTGKLDGTYSFTFDEIRDYCLSKYILSQPSFVEYLESLSPFFEDDTLLKISRFIFLELKESKDIVRYNEFKKFSKFNDVYGLNILSVEPTLWDDNDIKNIENSIYSFYEQTFETLAYRLIYDGKIPCVYNLINAYFKINLTDRIEWEDKFLGADNYYFNISFFNESLFGRLLQLKSKKIEDDEILGLLWLGTLLSKRLDKHIQVAESVDLFYKKIYEKNPKIYLKAAEHIRIKCPEFAYVGFLRMDE